MYCFGRSNCAGFLRFSGMAKKGGAGMTELEGNAWIPKIRIVLKPNNSFSFSNCSDIYEG